MTRSQIHDLTLRHTPGKSTINISPWQPLHATKNGFVANNRDEEMCDSFIIYDMGERFCRFGARSGDKWPRSTCEGLSG